jgi:hypothetical protein
MVPLSVVVVGRVTAWHGTGGLFETIRSLELWAIKKRFIKREEL